LLVPAIQWLIANKEGRFNQPLPIATESWSIAFLRAKLKFFFGIYLFVQGETHSIGGQKGTIAMVFLSARLIRARSGDGREDVHGQYRLNRTVVQISCKGRMVHLAGSKLGD